MQQVNSHPVLLYYSTNHYFFTVYPMTGRKPESHPITKALAHVEEPSNYRPISVVSHISKVFEKCVNVQLMQYFESHNLLRCDQSAFRKKHSTTTALHRLVDDLLDNMNEGMVNAICFFDRRKCFDSIDHKLLILKLEKYGILDREMLWLTDYLYDRTQSVFVNGSSSSFNDINVGVPQGSVWGP